MIVAVNALDGEHRAGDNIVCVSINFSDSQEGLFEVVKNQLPILAGGEVDGLRGFITHHIRVGDGLLNDLIAVHGDVGEDGFTVRPGGHVIVIVKMDALDLKDGSGNDLFGLCVPFQNGEGGQLLIAGGHGDSPAAVDGGLIHMGDDRIGEGGIGRCV